jgi:hypothetical protein
MPLLRDDKSGTPRNAGRNEAEERVENLAAATRQRLPFSPQLAQIEAEMHRPAGLESALLED